MMEKILFIWKDIYRICSSVVKEIGHDLLEDTDLVSLGIKGEELPLFLIGKVVKPGKVAEYGFLQKLLYLSAMEFILIQAGPELLVFRRSLQIGGYLGDIGKLNDLFKLLICHKSALHGTDLGGKPAV